MKIAVFGATGGLGAASVRSALEAGHHVTALVRTPAKVKLVHERLALVQGDVLDAAAVHGVVAGRDAVLSALGPAKGTPPGTLISTGTGHMIDGMARAGVRRFVFASGLMAGTCAGMGLVGRGLVAVFRRMMHELYVDKVRAEALVQDSGLDWVIVRPPVLADLPARGTYRAAPDLDVKVLEKMSFADTGDYMVRALVDDQALHKAIELSY
jgi:putative NADH-flavin reductase